MLGVASYPFRPGLYTICSLKPSEKAYLRFFLPLRFMDKNTVIPVLFKKKKTFKKG